MSILVRHPGTQSTIQDLGRLGFASSGVATSGAADTLSLRVGNRLLSNTDNAAGIECALAGGVFEFQGETSIVLTGARARAMISARAGTTIAIDTWRPRRCDPGDTLAVGALAGGARMYVCVAGGVQSTITLASRSTQVSTSAGGVGGLAPSGRHAGVGTPLSAGDIIPTADHPAPTTFRDLPDTAREFIERTITRAALRIVPGPQSHTLPNSVRDRIASIPFQVSSHSNRTGLRLAGTPFIAGASPSMLTQPVAHGFIQLTPANELIILGPDAPPTGGYPVIASVISADLPRAGQCFPGETVTLEWTTIERARRLIHDQMETFDALLPPA